MLHRLSFDSCFCHFSAFDLFDTNCCVWCLKCSLDCTEPVNQKQWTSFIVMLFMFGTIYICSVLYYQVSTEARTSEIVYLKSWVFIKKGGGVPLWPWVLTLVHWLRFSLKFAFQLRENMHVDSVGSMTGSSDSNINESFIFTLRPSPLPPCSSCASCLPHLQSLLIAEVLYNLFCATEYFHGVVADK